MSQLIFQSISGGTVTLNGPNTAGTYNLAIPAANGTLLYQDLTGNITFNNIIVTGSLTITGTSAFGIPVGTTAQRPTTPAAGQIRYNTDGGGLYEGYLPAVSAWYKFSMVPEGQYNIVYLAVAGGAGGGTGVISGASSNGGGGGAGGLFTSTIVALPSTVFNVIVGAGGPTGTNGYNSSISGVLTAIGGGAGGTNGAGGAGGSGGGGGAYNAAGGGATLSQGNAGGDGGGTTGGGGGGGAGTAGVAGAAGAGGSGSSNATSGVSVIYAGGGGGGGESSAGAGGSGGGGNGGTFGFAGGNGVLNRGGGGGGGGPFAGVGGSGGAGIVIFSMPTVNYSGNITGAPTVTTSGLNTILTFTSSGSYTA
jgi:hypothetical protein